MRARPSSPGVFFGQDRYAAFALGHTHEIGSSFADSDVFVASRGLSESVIPDIDEGVLAISGDDAAQVDAVREVLLDRYSSRDLWMQPTLPMELQTYVTELVEHGEIFVRFHFDRASASDPYSLFETTWLAPETVIHRPRLGVFEQYASRRAFEGSGYVLDGEPREQLFEIPEREVFHLRWPLSGSARGSPAKSARSLGEEVAKHANRTLLAARAGAIPSETFLPIARARAGAFVDAMEKQKTASARIKDMLFYPGAYEAEVFPWADEITDYFAADRILRSRVAICRIRTYLFTELNRQVLNEWSRLNDWGELTLSLRPELFLETDWLAMREDLERGELALDDVKAAVAAEYDAGHQYGRIARSRDG